jgi:hypothetical protein
METFAKVFRLTLPVFIDLILLDPEGGFGVSDAVNSAPAAD